MINYLTNINVQGTVTISDLLTANSAVLVGTNQIQLGTDSNDMEIFHTGNNGYIDMINGTFYIRNASNANNFSFSQAGNFDLLGNITAGGSLNGTTGGFSGNVTAPNFIGNVIGQQFTASATSAIQLRTNGGAPIATFGSDFTSTFLGNIVGNGNITAATGNITGNRLYSNNQATANNELVRLDQLNSIIGGLDWQESVLDQLNLVTSEPASPTIGDRYISLATGTSSATSQAVTIHYIYEWNGTDWTEFIPNEGWTCWIEDVDTNFTYNGSTWVEFGSTVSHNNTTGLQGGQASQYYHLNLSDYTNLTADSSNLAYTNVNNNFSVSQTINGSLFVDSGNTNLVGVFTSTDATAEIALMDSATIDNTRVRLGAVGDSMTFRSAGVINATLRDNLFDINLPVDITGTLDVSGDITITKDNPSIIIDDNLGGRSVSIGLVNNEFRIKDVANNASVFVVDFSQNPTLLDIKAITTFERNVTFDQDVDITGSLDVSNGTDSIEVRGDSINFSRVAASYIRPTANGTHNLYIGNNSQGVLDWQNVYVYTNGSDDFRWNDEVVATQDWIQAQGYITSQTDSQTLSWNSANNALSISNGNTVNINTFGSGVTISTTQDQKLVLRAPSGDTTEWNYMGFVGTDGVRDGFFGVDPAENLVWHRDTTSNSIYLKADGTNEINGDTSITGTLEVSSNISTTNGFAQFVRNADATTPITLLKLENQFTGQNVAYEFKLGSSKELIIDGTSAASKIISEQPVDITGTLDVTGNITAGATIQGAGILASGTYPEIYVRHSGATLGGLRADAATKLELKTLTNIPIALQVAGSNVLEATSSGVDITGTLDVTDGTDTTSILYHGIEFDRTTSYLRPTQQATKNLYIGGFSQGVADWENIFVWTNGSNDFKWNNEIVATQDWVETNFAELSGDNIAYTNVNNNFSVTQSGTSFIASSLLESPLLKLSTSEGSVTKKAIRNAYNHMYFYYDYDTFAYSLAINETGRVRVTNNDLLVDNTVTANDLVIDSGFDEDDITFKYGSSNREHYIRTRVDGNSNASNHLAFWVATSTEGTAVETLKLDGNKKAWLYGDVDVSGNLNVSSTSTFNDTVSIVSSFPTLKFIDSDTGINDWRITGGNGYFDIYEETLNESRIRISTGGNVGIGMIPNYRLEVAGEIKANASNGEGFRLNGGNAILRQDSGMEIQTNSTTALTINSAQNAIFSGAISAGSTSSSNTHIFYSSSDAPLRVRGNDDFSGIGFKGSTGTEGYIYHDSVNEYFQFTQEIKALKGLDVTVTDSDRAVNIYAPNGENRFNLYAGGTGNSSYLQMYDHTGSTIGVQLNSAGISYINGTSLVLGGTVDGGYKFRVLGTSSLEGNTNIAGSLDVSDTVNVGVRVNAQYFRTNNFLAGQTGFQLEEGSASTSTLRFESDIFRFYAGSNATVPLTINENGNVVVLNELEAGSLDINGIADISGAATFGDIINMPDNKAVTWSGGSIRAEGTVLKLGGGSLIDLQQDTQVQGTLDVSGNLNATGATHTLGSGSQTGQTTLLFQQDDNLSNGFYLGYFGAAANDFGIYGYENAPFRVYTNGTLGLTLDASQNLNVVGKVTAADLQINLVESDTAKIRGNNDAQLRLEGADDHWSGIGFIGSTGTPGYLYHNSINEYFQMTHRLDALLGISVGTSSATTGEIRLPNNATIQARNSANTGNRILMRLDSSDILQIAESGSATNFGGTVTINGATHITSGSNLTFFENKTTSAAILNDIVFQNNGMSDTDKRAVVFRALTNEGASTSKGGRVDLSLRQDDSTSFTTHTFTPTLATLNTGLTISNGDLLVNTTGGYVEMDVSDNSLKLSDNTTLKVGTGNDLQIYHNGTHSFINNAGTGEIIFADAGSGVWFSASNGIYLYDNNSLYVGSGADLRIYHNGTNNYINAVNGDLRIGAYANGNDIHFNTELTAGTVHDVLSIYGGAETFVRLRHNNTTRLDTTSTGVDVTGRVEANYTTDEISFGAFAVNRSLGSSRTNNARGFSDATVWDGSTSALGYAGFDSKQTISNATTFDHTTSFQARPTITNSTITDIEGLAAYGNSMTDSTVTKMAGVYVDKPFTFDNSTITNFIGMEVAAGAGTNGASITNFYGMYIGDGTVDATNKYAIFSDDNTVESKHDGKFVLGDGLLSIYTDTSIPRIEANTSLPLFIENANSSGGSIVLRAADSSGTTRTVISAGFSGTNTFPTLYHNTNAKLVTTNTGVEVTGDYEYSTGEVAQKKGEFDYNTDASTSYTIASTDKGEVIGFTSASAVTVTVNAGSLTDVGDICYIDQMGSGEITIAAGAGNSLLKNGSVQLKTNGLYSRVAIHKVGSTSYRVFGELKPV